MMSYDLRAGLKVEIARLQSLLALQEVAKRQYWPIDYIGAINLARESIRSLEEEVLRIEAPPSDRDAD